MASYVEFWLENGLNASMEKKPSDPAGEVREAQPDLSNR